MKKPACWLMKTEPETYSIDDLARDGRTCWEGVRNYQARNYLRDEMKVGDLVLIYHSNASPPCVAGVARVVRSAYPDPTVLDRRSPYHDPKATEDNPIWMMVDLAFEEKFAQFVTLDALKKDKSLTDMLVLKRGQRLSIMPVSATHFEGVRSMGKR